MKSAILRLLMLAGVIMAFALAHFSQTGQTQTAMSGRMFDGETIKYEAKLNKILRGLPIAEITFVATASPDSNQLVIKSEAVSKGTLIKMFGVSFLQQYESAVDLDLFRITKTVKHEIQKERVRDSIADFDYKEKRVTCVETDPKDKTRQPRLIASDIPDAMNDYASGLFAVRLMPLAVGQSFVVPVSDTGFVYKIPINVRGRELQKTVLGNVWCYRIEPDVFGKGKLIEREGRMMLWYTDDVRHLPVRATIETEYGKLDVKLKSYRKAVMGSSDRP